MLLMLVAGAVGLWAWPEVATSRAAAAGGPGAVTAQPAAVVRGQRPDGGGPLASVADSAAGPVAPLAAASPTGRFGPVPEQGGRTASLTVRLLCGGLPATAEVHLAAGADAGRVGTTDAAGEVCWEGLIPGRVLVEVTTAEGLGCRRDVLLRHRRRAELELDLGDHGPLRGVVRDSAGVPVPDALVQLDGAWRRSGPEGAFELVRSVSPTGVLRVQAPGFALHEQHVGDAENGLAITLRPGASVRLSLSGDPVWGDGAWLVLLPEGDPVRFGAGGLRATYPWADHAGQRLAPGEDLVLDGLPSCRLRVLAFGAGARSCPAPVMVRPGQPVRLTLQPESLPALTIRVVRGADPVPGARVALEPANGASDRLLLLGDQRAAAERWPLPLPPQLNASVVSDADGQARLARPPGGGWVTVTDPRGALVVTRVVEPHQASLRIDLAAPADD